MLITKTPEFLKPLASDFWWSIPTWEKEVFLTFDDGPTPGVTEEVLDILQRYQAKGTFFCLGKNVENYPEIFQRIIQEGHSYGNHSYTHPDGWKTETFSYLKNVIQASQVISSPLFRPPYGHITRQQSQALKSRFQHVMWDIITGDWDQKRRPEQCAQAVIQNVKSGSIIVFHDSAKAMKNVIPALIKTLDYLANEGYTCSAINTSRVFKKTSK